MPEDEVLHTTRPIGVKNKAGVAAMPVTKLNSPNLRLVGVSRTPAERERPTTGVREGSFHHETLFYVGEDGFLRGALPFINDALASEEPVLVAVHRAKTVLLREALGDEAPRVHFIDMQLIGRNPARMIPLWRELLQAPARARRPARAIGEVVWAGRSQAELMECRRHESLLNLAFDGGQPWSLLCPYDLDAVDERVIEAALRSHPFITQDGEHQCSRHYLPWRGAPDALSEDLPPPSARPGEMAFTAEDLRGLRRFVTRRSASAMLSATRTEQLVLAVNELAANSVRHGGGQGILRMWREAETLVCEVEDSGRIEDPLVGCSRPSPDQCSGFGVWLANHLCDLVQIRSTSKGSLVRVHVRIL
jgi:anti-sigma regulatory factor (Ser/Thr protein kinase)